MAGIWVKAGAAEAWAPLPSAGHPEWLVDGRPARDDQKCLIAHALAQRDSLAGTELTGTVLAEAVKDGKGARWNAQVWSIDSGGGCLRFVGNAERVKLERRRKELQQQLSELEARGEMSRAAELRRQLKDLGPFGVQISLPALRSQPPVAAGTGGRYQVVTSSSIQLSDPTLVERALALQSCYEPACRMPERALDLLKAGGLNHLASSAVVLYPPGAQLSVVRDLALQRVPCNIAGRDLFDPKKLQECFGWSKAFYNRYYDQHSELAPNIAVACTSTMWRQGFAPVEVHVVNLIGYAFDSESQADFKYFQKYPQELVPRMQTMWRHMFAAAHAMKLQRILLAKVGGGAFSHLLPKVLGTPHKSPGEVYEALLKDSLEPVKLEGPNQEILVEPLGRIPDDVFNGTLGELSSTLLVNAWDMLTVVGNGNAADHSLDGFFGRCTAMGVLCWPMTNPHLRYLEAPTPAAASVPTTTVADTEKVSSPGPATGPPSTAPIAADPEPLPKQRRIEDFFRKR